MGIATCIIDKTLQKIIDFFIVFVYNMVNNIKRSVPIYILFRTLKGGENMVTNAVAFNMSGGTNATVQRSESENGFSDVLDSVNKASPKTTRSESGEKFAYTEVRGTEKAVTAETSSPEMSEKAGEILDEAASSLRIAFSELVESLKSETDEDAKNEIISALLEILRKLKPENEDDENMTGVMELLITVLIPAENSDVSSEVSENGDISVVEAYSAVDEKSGEIRLISEGSGTTETMAQAPEAEKSSITTAAAPVQQEAQPAEAAETKPEMPENRLERLLNEILSEAKKDLGLTEVRLSSNDVVSGEKLQGMPVSFNPKHSDRSGELSEILGKNTPEAAEVKNAETRTETEGAVHLAANLFDNTPNVTARLESQPLISEANEAAPPEVQTADEILARMESLRNGETEFTMVLNPESLGRITVKLVTSGERVAVQITAENPDTGKLLEARTENLTAMLRDNGVELERCQVVSEGENAGLMQDSYEGSSKNPYSRQEEKGQDENDEEESFFDLLQSI